MRQFPTHTPHGSAKIACTPTATYNKSQCTTRTQHHNASRSAPSKLCPIATRESPCPSLCGKQRETAAAMSYSYRTNMTTKVLWPFNLHARLQSPNLQLLAPFKVTFNLISRLQSCLQLLAPFHVHSRLHPICSYNHSLVCIGQSHTWLLLLKMLLAILFIYFCFQNPYKNNLFSQHNCFPRNCLSIFGVHNFSCLVKLKKYRQQYFLEQAPSVQVAI